MRKILKEIFDKEWNDTKTRWKGYWSKGVLFLVAYCGCWLLALTMFLWVPPLLRWMVGLTHITDVSVLQEIIAPLVGPFCWLIAIVGEGIILYKRGWIYPVRQVFYTLILGEWPYRSFRGDGRPHLKNPFAHAWPMFSGTLPMNDEISTTKVYSKSDLLLPYNWALSLEVSDPSQLLTSRFPEDFRHFRLKPGEVRTSGGEVDDTADVEIANRIKASQLFKLAMAAIPGLLEGTVAGQEFAKMNSDKGREKAKEVMDKKLRTLLGRPDPKDPDNDEKTIECGVRINFVPQNVDLPESVSEISALRDVALKRGEIQKIELEQIAEALDGVGISPDQKAEIIKYFVVAKARGGVVGVVDVGASKRGGGHRK